MADVNPEIAIDFHSLAAQISDGLLKERLLAILSGFFGLLAAILATVGLYGVMAYMVAKRTNEIGIRMALGAAPIQMLELVLSEAGKLCGVGVAIGVVVTLVVGRWAASLIFGLKPYNPAVLATACLGLAVVAVQPQSQRSPPVKYEMFWSMPQFIPKSTLRGREDPQFRSKHCACSFALSRLFTLAPPNSQEANYLWPTEKRCNLHALSVSTLMLQPIL